MCFLLVKTIHRHYTQTQKVQHQQQKGIKQMSQPLPLFPEVCKTVTGVIAPTNAGEIILRFSITGGELDSVPQGTQT